MKKSLLLTFAVFLLIGSMLIATGIQSTEAAINLNSSKSNIYRSVSPQASGDDSQATFQQVNVNQESAGENNCSGGAQCSLSVSNNIGDVFSSVSKGPPP